MAGGGIAAAKRKLIMNINKRCVVCGAGKFQMLFKRNRGAMERCRACGLVQVVPMPTGREIAALYHEDFDHFAPYLEQLEVHRAYFRQKLASLKGKRFLDIGCAMGVLLEEAQKRGIEAYGVDISKDAVAYCRKKGLRVSENFPKKKFDVVTAFQVIEHERDPVRFMNRVHTLLKKGGLFVLATPNYGGWWRRVMGKRWVGFTHPEHVTLWSPRSLTFLMEKTGFKNITVRRDDPRPFPLSFLFARAADYFPWAAWLAKPMGKLLDRFDMKNPINPWDDMIVFARK